MRWYSKVILGALLFASAPVLAIAQNDICGSGVQREQGDQARAEQLRIEAAERQAREVERRTWDVKMFTVKNPVEQSRYRALCIFRVEVVLQPALKIVQVRAPKDMMPAVEEALKTLDVPPPPPVVLRGVEVSAYILVTAERAADPNWMPVPRELESVANQLKNLFPNDMLFLADTVVARGTERQSLSISGMTVFGANVSVRDGATPVVRLESLEVITNGGRFKTSIDIPVGTQVVVGKATSTFPPKKAVVLVITAKLLN